MARGRAMLGAFVGGLLILSAVAHSVLGWPAVRAEIAAAGVGPDLTRSLEAGWQFGGAAMAAFGAIVLALFLRRLRGVAASTLPAQVIGVAYIAFGAWALVVSGLSPFFLVFIIPGLLLLVAAAGPAPPGR